MAQEGPEWQKKGDATLHSAYHSELHAYSWERANLMLQRPK